MVVGEMGVKNVYLLAFDILTDGSNIVCPVSKRKIAVEAETVVMRYSHLLYFLANGPLGKITWCRSERQAHVDPKGSKVLTQGNDRGRRSGPLPIGKEVETPHRA
jgi:hypothetical protein